MKTKHIIKKHIVTEFFEFPENSVVAWLKTHKFNYITDKLGQVHSNLYIVNRTSKFDKLFVARTFNFDFVFLKDEYTEKIINDTISKEERTSILRQISILQSLSVSLVIFAEKHQSIFGDSEEITRSMTNFIHELKMPIRFFNLIGTYFTQPIWAKEPRPCTTKNAIQYSISSKQSANATSDEFYSLLNNYKPSSASAYAKKIDPSINYNKRAENLETLLYCCPSCKSFFTLYSEYNCIKCKECGKAIEILPNAEINLAKNIETLDDFKEFQFNVLSNLDFTIKPFVKYQNVNICIPDINYKKFKSSGTTEVTIYADKFTVQLADKTKEYQINKIQNIKMLYDNVVIITFKKEELILRGDNKENFYILFDLMKIVK